MKIPLRSAIFVCGLSFATLLLTAMVGRAATVDPSPPAQATDIPAMTKDADTLTAGIQDTNNLWLNNSGCVNEDQGNGCLVVDDAISGIYDVDDPGDPDLDPEGLGAWETQVQYDDSLVTIDPVADETWLESTGRSAGCAVMTLNPTAKLAGCVTAGAGIPGPNGPESAAGRVMRIHIAPKLNDLIQLPSFRPRPGNGETTSLTDVNCEVADTLGEMIPGSLPGGLTVVCSDVQIKVRTLEGDIDLDCGVSIDDAQQAATAYGIASLWHDLQPSGGDGDVDVFDVQAVWGRVGSTCASPFPAYQGSPLEPAPSPVPPPADADASLNIGEESGLITASLAVADIPEPGIGAVKIDLSFDGDVVEPIGITSTSGLESTGRTANCQLGSPPYYRFQRSRVSFACVTRDGSGIPGSDAGVRDASALVSFAFRRLGPGAPSIALAGVGFSAPSGTDMVFEDPLAVGGVAEAPEVSGAATSSGGGNHPVAGVLATALGVVGALTFLGLYVRGRRRLN